MALDNFITAISAAVSEDPGDSDAQRLADDLLGVMVEEMNDAEQRGVQVDFSKGGKFHTIFMSQMEDLFR